MLLAIDVGNTNIVLGVFDGATLVQSWRLQTLRERTSDELGLLVDGLFAHSRIERVQIRGVILGSVVPPLTGTIRAMVQRYFGVTADRRRARRQHVDADPLRAIPPKSAPIASSTRSRPTRSSAAALGRPLIVVDFGTATTLDAITAKGEYLGGAICPGVTISADALFQRAARLPRIDVRKPARVVGRTTVGAMESGLFWGYVGMVEGLVRRMSDELGGDAICVATGGLADVIAPETPLIQHVDADLTLHGLRIVWERNQ